MVSVRPGECPRTHVLQVVTKSTRGGEPDVRRPRENLLAMTVRRKPSSVSTGATTAKE